ncbi:MAG: putative Formyl-CoA transferase [Rhizobacter sp.]|nr:putative Formyl-CoA transferase [Rhizobacter sp.]
MTAGPLAGLRVLDAATLFAAPLISALLADHGADVVVLEPPGGDSFRTSPFWPVSARGKRSVTVDPDDREALHVLVAAADVVVVNEPVRRLQRRGLDPDSLLAVNPSLVVAHVNGYGVDGPYADRPGNGTLAEAFAGLTHVTGDPDGPPVLPSVPLGDAVMALTGAFGVLAAIHDVRSSGGSGRVVDVNPVDAMLQVVAPTVTGLLPGQQPPGRLGSGMAGAAMRGVFRSADDRWIAASLSTPRQREDLGRLVGAPDAQGAALKDATREWMRRHLRAEALDRLVAARLPAAPVNDAGDVAADPHLRARGALRTVRTPDGDEIALPSPAPRTVGAPPTRTSTLAAPGEHTTQVLEEWARAEPTPAPDGAQPNVAGP